ncbi:PAS domain S-box protein [Sulfuricella sp.]|uniref:sensor histidine kinase n=1 Tax=Sulfuricella sp. TaxID=2099377 RepID=UPI002CB4B6AD|nr:PAS domain S-box protein [Sulfuricella sp.]HUX63114.1 PAS domain S-box protein [Sulfuricella sp.]
MTASDSKNKSPRFSGIPTWIPLLAFILLTFLIGAAGYAIFEQNKKSITEKEVQNLGAMADLKVAQIVAWREAHRQRAEMFLNNSLLPDEVDLWLREGAQADKRKERILSILTGLRQVQNYRTISLLDKEGATRISTNDSYAPDTEAIKLAVEAMRSQRVLFSDLHKEGHKDNRIKIDSVAPLRVTDENNATRIVGALLFEIDPDSFLYPLVQSWPIKSQSTETLLVRRDGDDVLFLSELRHKKGAALSLRIPLTNKQLPGAQAMLGSAKVTEGIDYRGVPVIATLRRVPDTPWFMVSKIDKAELFAPVNILQRWVTGLGFAFAVLGGALVFVWFKGYRARYAHLKMQHDGAVEREMLVKHFDYLTKYANDIVLLLNAQGRIVEANDRAALAYGYPKEQLKTMSLGALLAPGIDLRSRLEEIEKKEGLKFESVHVRKNGAVFPVESSVRAITIEGERYFQAIIRDITERKRAESALRKSEALLKASQQMAHIGSWELDHRNAILFWSEENFRIFEVDPALFDASYEAFLDAVHPDDRAMVDKAYTDSLKNRTPYTIVHRLLFPDQRVKFVQEWCETQYDHEGRPIRSIGTTEDITERKQAEEALRRQKNFILQVIDTDPNLIFVKDAKGKFLLVNQAMATLHGKTVQELIGMDAAELFRNREEFEPHLQADREAIASGRTVTFVAKNFLGGKERWLHVTKVPMKQQSDGSVNVLGIAVDITERKLGEERLNESYKELEKLTTHLEVVREDEQKRIARELHDEMGGVLAALNINVSMLAEQIPAEMTDIQTKVAGLGKLVAAGIQAMQRAVTELRPTLLDEVGLKFAIERYVQEFEKNTEIECDLHLPEEALTLDENQSTTIFRIIQESLTNVAKHAKANRVSIVLSEWDTSLVLTVKDNGKGFDLNIQKAKSFGLLGIRERAAMVGGTALITSAAGKGTTVRVSLPLTAGRHEGGPARE